MTDIIDENNNYIDSLSQFDGLDESQIESYQSQSEFYLNMYYQLQDTAPKEEDLKSEAAFDYNSYIYYDSGQIMEGTDSYPTCSLTGTYKGTDATLYFEKNEINCDTLSFQLDTTNLTLWKNYIGASIFYELDNQELYDSYCCCRFTSFPFYLIHIEMDSTPLYL